MKKLLLLCIGIALFTSCEKAVLKPTTVKVIANDVKVNMQVTNDKKKYFEGVTEDQIREMYIQSFKDELGRNKIDLTQTDPDYIIEINTINIQEWVQTVEENDQWIDLSKIDIQATYTMTESMVDVPNMLHIEDDVQEDIEENKKGKKDKDKGSKWGTSGKVEIDGFGGLEGALESHSKEARKEIKRKFKKRQ